MNKINIAVVGFGYWGPNIVRNLLTISQIDQIYVYDKDYKRLKQCKENFPRVQTLQSFEEVLTNEKITGVFIATPLSSHYSLSAQVLKANKHVFIEKPMCESSTKAKMLIKLAEKEKRLLMVGHTFVYSETVKKIKSLINKDSLGKVYYYDSTRINLGNIQSDSSVVWDLAPHDLSIINYLFSEKIISVQAFGSSFINKNFEIAHIFLRLERNISAHIHISWLSPVKIRSILIGGSKKMIVYDDIQPSEKIKIYDKGVVPSKKNITPFAPAYRSGDVMIPHLEQKEALRTELIHFVDCIVKNKLPLTSGYDGLKVVSLLEAIDKALITHKEVML